MKFVVENKEKIQQFVAVFSKLRLLTDSVTIYFREDSVYVQGMDASQITMFEFQLISNWFKEYNNDMVDNESQVSLSTNMFSNVLKCVENTTTYMRFEVCVDNVEFEIHVDEGKYIKGFKIPKLSVEHMLLDIPDTEMPVEVGMNTAMLKKFLSEQLTFGESITIVCNDDNVVFTVDGDGMEMMTSMGIDSVDTYAIIEGSEITASYNLNMLCKFMEFAKLSKSVTLYVSDEMPLKLMYNLDHTTPVKNENKTDDDDAEEHKGEEEDEEEEEEEEEENIENFFAIYMAPKMDD